MHLSPWENVVQRVCAMGSCKWKVSWREKGWNHGLGHIGADGGKVGISGCEILNGPGALRVILE